MRHTQGITYPRLERLKSLITAVSSVVSLMACTGAAQTDSYFTEPELSVAPPPGFPAQRLSIDNSWSLDKARLGRWLFYDRRLSGNQTFSCASCHKQHLAFTDGLPTSVGSTGEHHFRSAMSLTNVGYLSPLTWANANERSLAQQALGPMFGNTPIELGLSGLQTELLARLRADPRYRELFPLAFRGETDPFTVDNVTRALEAFERTLLSANSPYDRHQRGDSTAMSPSALRGMALFNSEITNCSHCHGGFNFTDSVATSDSTTPPTVFHNTGLYNLDGRGDYPPSDTGLNRQTHRPEDMGFFRAPSLRNIAVTAPYMHDGSIATLDAVISHYASGGRTITSGPNAGVGSANPYKSPLVHGFALTNTERADLIEFLRALTDPVFLSDRRFADPYSTPR